MQTHVKTQYQFKLSDTEYQLLARLVRHAYVMVGLEDDAVTAYVMVGLEDDAVTTTVAEFVQYLPEDADSWDDVEDGDTDTTVSDAAPDADDTETKPRLGLFRRHSA